MIGYHLITSSFSFFLCSAAAPIQWCLEVEMRFEQITAAVTRRLAVAEVREILCVELFAVATSLHLWLQRTPLGMPSYSGSDLMSSLDDDAGRINTREPGNKRGRHCQFHLAMACCPAGIAKA